MGDYVDCSTCKTDCKRNSGRYGYTFCGRYTPPEMPGITNEMAANILKNANMGGVLRQAADMGIAALYGQGAELTACRAKLQALEKAIDTGQLVRGPKTDPRDLSPAVGVNGRGDHGDS